MRRWPFPQDDQDEAEEEEGKKRQWRRACSFGIFEVSFTECHLRDKMMKFIDLSGMKFSRWSVISYAGNRHWNCRCICGREKQVFRDNLIKGKSRSCGCLSSEITKDRFWKHGYAQAGKILPEYRSWQHMKDRCYNPQCRDFPDYGGRGITIYEKWLEDFGRFYEHVGPRPGPSYTIDRVDVNGNYEPGNVRWATPKQQSRNRRNVAKIGFETAPELRLANGISRSTYHRRLRNGWTAEMAATISPRPKRPAGTGRARVRRGAVGELALRAEQASSP